MKMEKLILLKFFSRQLDEISTNRSLPRGLTMLPNSLTYLSWDHYPNKFLASKFHPLNLVGLFLRQSCQTTVERTLGNISFVFLFARVQ